MRVGVVGGGQLGRMLALAAPPLDIEVAVLDGSTDATAARVAPLIVGDFGDRAALAQLAERSDVVTFDFENVPADAADWLATRVAVRPAPSALRASQDRIVEKSLFNELAIPCAPFAAVDDAASLATAIERVGLPAVLKTRRLGYDGKGQRVVDDVASAEAARVELGGGDLILEAFVPFRRELSIIAARGVDGSVVRYPLVENHHRDGILRTTLAPASDPRHDADAADFVSRLLARLDYVGVITLELFECDDGLRANEFAPRVHNSGHWTIEGARTSQFENHLRAVAGMPLGDPSPVGHAAMVNFIGGLPSRAAVEAIAGASFHDYQKSARAGRKIGHATLVRASAADRDAALAELVALADAAAR